ncbi:hypothetical protein H4R19_001708 [Coemansia spiralis]|nr:hypothetical protein H4R19_001708 [Coemansia spiralis]
MKRPTLALLGLCALQAAAGDKSSSASTGSSSAPSPTHCVYTIALPFHTVLVDCFPFIGQGPLSSSSHPSPQPAFPAATSWSPMSISEVGRSPGSSAKSAPHAASATAQAEEHGRMRLHVMPTSGALARRGFLVLDLALSEESSHLGSLDMDGTAESSTHSASDDEFAWPTHSTNKGAMSSEVSASAQSGSQLEDGSWFGSHAENDNGVAWSGIDNIGAKLFGGIFDNNDATSESSMTSDSTGESSTSSSSTTTGRYSVSTSSYTSESAANSSSIVSSFEHGTSTSESLSSTTPESSPSSPDKPTNHDSTSMMSSTTASSLLSTSTSAESSQTQPATQAPAIKDGSAKYQESGVESSPSMPALSAASPSMPAVPAASPSRPASSAPTPTPTRVANTEHHHLRTFTNKDSYTVLVDDANDDLGGFLMGIPGIDGIYGVDEIQTASGMDTWVDVEDGIKAVIDYAHPNYYTVFNSDGSPLTTISRPVAQPTSTPATHPPHYLMTFVNPANSATLLIDQAQSNAGILEAGIMGVDGIYTVPPGGYTASGTGTETWIDSADELVAIIDEAHPNMYTVYDFSSQPVATISY